MEVPQQKGSVLEPGRVRMTWVGLSMLGRNWIEHLEGWELGSKFPVCEVNSLQQRKPA
jgi:hypothetical protein